MKIALSYKSEKMSEEFISSVKEKVLSYGFELDDCHPDVVLFIGGDGTFLRSVHQYLNQLDKVSFIGLCKGHLGFFYSYDENELDSLLSDLKRGVCKKESHYLLKATVDNEEIYALNEIRIESPFHTLISDVYINEEFLETFRGNGLVVSTPLGSSAYHKSLGGAIIDHDLEVLELTEVAGIQNNVTHSLGSSLILKGDKTISFEGELVNSVVGYDFASYHKEEALKKLSISYSDKEVKVIVSKGHSYIKKIKRSFVA